MKRIFIRLRIIDIDNNNLIPCSYNHQLFSLVMNFVDDKSLHEEKAYKKFVFSKLNISFDKIINKNFRLNDSNISFTISADEKWVNLLLKNIDYKKIYNIGNLEVRLVEVKTYDVDYSNKNLILFQTDSPVVIKTNRDTKKTYLSPDDDRYDELLKQNIERKLGNKIDDFNLVIDNGTVKRKAVKIKNNYVIAYTYSGIIKSNDSKVIETICNMGLGSKNTMGFGYIKVLKAN